MKLILGKDSEMLKQSRGRTIDTPRQKFFWLKMPHFGAIGKAKAGMVHSVSGLT